MAPDVNTLPGASDMSPDYSQHSSQEHGRMSPHRARPSSLTLGSPAPSHVPQDRSVPPVRHSRPMTPAEMHLELEQEQEAVVNRLQRELSALRAQTASVASNASSSSAATAGSNNVAVFDGTEPSSARTESLTGPTHPTPSRQHRSSSSLSSRSRSSTLTNPATPAIPIGSTSQASLDRARDATGISAPTATRSRGSSAVPPVQPFPWLSATASPSLAVASPQDFFTPTPSSAGPTSALTTQPSSRLHASPASAVSSARMEEASKAKEALQEANAEHESLVRKAKELERKLRGLSVHGESGDQERSRGRSEARATGDD